MPRVNFPVGWSSLRTTETSAPRTTSLRFRPSTGLTPESSLGESLDSRGKSCKRQQSFGHPAERMRYGMEATQAFPSVETGTRVLSWGRVIPGVRPMTSVGR